MRVCLRAPHPTCESVTACKKAILATIGPKITWSDFLELFPGVFLMLVILLFSESGALKLQIEIWKLKVGLKLKP